MLFHNAFGRSAPTSTLFSEGEIACLENHGYSLADAAVRSYAPAAVQNPGAPFQWPYPNWIDEGKCLTALARSHDRAILQDIFRLLCHFGGP